MATLGELNILLKLQGATSFNSALKNAAREVGTLKKEVKGAALAMDPFTMELREVSNKTGPSFDKQIKNLSGGIRKFSSDLRLVETSLKNVGTIIAGTFTGAFIAASKEVPAVSNQLNALKE